jgi:hypothetical protein
MRLWRQKWKIHARWHSQVSALLAVVLMFLYWPLGAAVYAVVSAQISVIVKVIIAAMLVMLAAYVAEQARQMVVRYDRGDPAN